MFIKLKINVFQNFAQSIAFGIASFFERHQEFHSRFKTNGEISSYHKFNIEIMEDQPNMVEGSEPLKKCEIG